MQWRAMFEKTEYQVKLNHNHLDLDYLSVNKNCLVFATFLRIVFCCG